VRPTRRRRPRLAGAAVAAHRATIGLRPRRLHAPRLDAASTPRVTDTTDLRRLRAPRARRAPTALQRPRRTASILAAPGSERADACAYVGRDVPRLRATCSTLVAMPRFRRPSSQVLRWCADTLVANGRPSAHALRALTPARSSRRVPVPTRSRRATGRGNKVDSHALARVAGAVPERETARLIRDSRWRSSRPAREQAAPTIQSASAAGGRSHRGGTLQDAQDSRSCSAPAPAVALKGAEYARQIGARPRGSRTRSTKGVMPHGSISIGLITVIIDRDHGSRA
jgi:hypothetical protein